MTVEVVHPICPDNIQLLFRIDKSSYTILCSPYTPTNDMCDGVKCKCLLNTLKVNEIQIRSMYTHTHLSLRAITQQM